MNGGKDMKKVLCLIVVTLILLCGCSPTKEDTFTKNKNGNIVSNSGVEYTHLANEGILYYLGDLDFIGSIQGEKRHLSTWNFRIKQGCLL